MKKWQKIRIRKRWIDTVNKDLEILGAMRIEMRMIGSVGKTWLNCKKFVNRFNYN